MRIRAYRPTDNPTLGEIYLAAVHEIGAMDYSAEQVRAWAGGDAATLSARLADKMTDGRRCWVAVDDKDAVVAFVDLEDDGHIDFLYASPTVAGTGVASNLLNELEDAARMSGLHRLHVEASEAARRFFIKRGYAVDQRRDFEIDGVAIHNYVMSVRL